MEAAQDQMSEDEWHHPDNPLLGERLRRYLVAEEGMSPEEAEAVMRGSNAVAIRTHREFQDQQMLEQALNEAVMAQPLNEDMLRRLAIPEGSEEPDRPGI